VRLDGEQLVREAQQLMGRGAEPEEEEEEDLDWVRRRMEEVQMSSPGENARPGGNQKETARSRRNQGESVRAVRNRGGNAKVSGPESSGVLRGEGRRNSEPASQVGLARTATTSCLAITPVAPACARCEGPVFMAELIRAENQAWHKCCFTCLECGKSLNPGSCCPREGEVHCQPCYQKNYGPHGVGFGLGSSLQAPP